MKKSTYIQKNVAVKYIVSFLCIFSTSLLVNSCGSYEWETVDFVQTENFCVSANSMISGALNPPILEILIYDDCEEPKSGHKLVRMIKKHRDARIQILQEGIIVASTFSMPENLMKTYFIANGMLPPDDVFEIDYGEIPENLQLLTSDSTDSIWIEVDKSESWGENTLLRVYWIGIRTDSPEVPEVEYSSMYNELYFLNLRESNFHINKDKKVQCELIWNGSESVDTLLLTPPDTLSGFFSIQAQ